MPPGWPSGATYSWWVLVYKGTDPAATPYNYGESYDTRSLVVNYRAAGQGIEPGEVNRPAADAVRVELEPLLGDRPPAD